MTKEIVEELGLPEIILDPSISIDNLLKRYPELKEIYDLIDLSENDAATDADVSDFAMELKKLVLHAKVLGNTLGQNTQSPVVSAQQYQQWTKDLEYLEGMYQLPPGGIRKGGVMTKTRSPRFDDRETSAQGKVTKGRGGRSRPHPGAGRTGRDSGSPSGGGGQGASTETRDIGPRTSLIDIPDLTFIDNELIERMKIREMLEDDELAAKLTPSMGLIEQLLYEKSNISGIALKNAKSLIKRFVTQMTEVLKIMVDQTPTGKIDYSVPPKRVFRNLDMKRTIWRNLPYWDPESRKLYINHLYYHHTAKKKNPKRLIVVVDQSGSMVDAMVQCTILASIFAGIPNVSVDLLAFDTRILDLTPWVSDPFEALLRTQLGGGTHIYQALVEAANRVTNPKSTAIVLISDFYEGGSREVLFDYIKSLIDSDIHFIPVGSVTSSGYFSVDEWFRSKLKSIGHPILTGSPKKLIAEIKQAIVT
ncbi:MAG: VWA domain-containing protein [Candidatus Thorarchaeota archaeon]|nr:VWA domain-containing protein [Candidatus Thorarchaeota archaeon]